MPVLQKSEMCYRPIIIGTGVWRSYTLGIKGESLGHVHFAINYLKNPDVYNLGQSAIIIGAGNAAMDVARTVIRKGTRNVTVFFLMGEDKFMNSAYKKFLIHHILLNCQLIRLNNFL